MSLETQINAVICGANGVLGTGLAGCRIDRKRVTALGLLTKGFKFTQEIDKDYLRTLQVSGDLIMLQGVVSFDFVQCSACRHYAHRVSVPME